MALTVTRTGQKWFLDAIATRLHSTAQIGLFQNDHMPTELSEFEDLVDANFFGYAQQNFGEWVAAYLNAANEAEAYAPTITWTFGGGDPQDIYGIFVISASGGTLLYAERHPLAPVTLSVVGDPFAYTPKLVVREF